MKKIVWITALIFWVISGKEVWGACEDRYTTIVNPIRDRGLWVDSDLKWLEGQYSPIAKRELPATWLVGYDVMKDREIMEKIKNFDERQEVGIFVEVSEKLARAARVVYPVNRPWYSPEAVFLSGYERSERKRMIDEMMNSFKREWGKWPKSVGAWWIDSYSINYMKDKYGIESVMIVADQKTTDNYGVWGQWWGAPYWPSFYNILKPAQNIEEKSEVVVIQWALRDPKKAYQGEGPEFSNYSLQANDYKERGLTTEHFKTLAAMYWDCQNKIGQITVGLEVGMEGAKHLDEYEKQIDYLKTESGSVIASMGEFAKKYKEINPQLSPETRIDGWILNLEERKNEELGDRVEYRQGVAWADYFIADKSEFLNRVMPMGREQAEKKLFPYWAGIVVVIGVGLIIKKGKEGGLIWLSVVGVGMGMFGLWLRSGQELGWQVFYVEGWKDLAGGQIAAVIGSFLMITGGMKIFRDKKWLVIMPAVSGIIGAAERLSLTIIEGRYFGGFLKDDLRMIGASIGKEGLRLENWEMPNNVAGSLLSLKLEEWWMRPGLGLMGAVMLMLLTRKLKGKWWRGIVVLLAGLYIWEIIRIIGADPVTVR